VYWWCAHSTLCLDVLTAFVGVQSLEIYRRHFRLRWSTFQRWSHRRLAPSHAGTDCWCGSSRPLHGDCVHRRQQGLASERRYRRATAAVDDDHDTVRETNMAAARSSAKLAGDRWVISVTGGQRRVASSSDAAAASRATRRRFRRLDNAVLIALHCCCSSRTIYDVTPHTVPVTPPAPPPCSEYHCFHPAPTVWDTSRQIAVRSTWWHRNTLRGTFVRTFRAYSLLNCTDTRFYTLLNNKWFLDWMKVGLL